MDAHFRQVRWQEATNLFLLLFPSQHMDHDGKAMRISGNADGQFGPKGGSVELLWPARARKSNECPLPCLNGIKPCLVLILAAPKQKTVRNSSVMLGDEAEAGWGLSLPFCRSPDSDSERYLSKL